MTEHLHYYGTHVELGVTTNALLFGVPLITVVNRKTHKGLGLSWFQDSDNNTRGWIWYEYRHLFKEFIPERVDFEVADGSGLLELAQWAVDQWGLDLQGAIHMAVLVFERLGKLVEASGFKDFRVPTSQPSKD